MKLISLNAWGGKLYDPFMDFIRSHAGADIVFLQEVFDLLPGVREVPNVPRADLFLRLQDLLPDHKPFFVSCRDNWDFEKMVPEPVRFGLAAFVKKSIPVRHHSSILQWSEEEAGITGRETCYFPRNFEHLIIEAGGRPLNLVNIHGLQMYDDKRDSPERVEQSRRVRAFLDTLQGPIILCGDFNTRPDAKLWKDLSRGLRNLNEEFGVTLTRSELYPGLLEWKDYVSDYILISPEITLKNFRVLSDMVSDHLPLVLEFE